MKLKPISIFAFSLMLYPLYAEDSSISTDRPDFVESSLAVKKYQIQVETSFESERDEVDSIETKTTASPTLVRFGLFKDFELRFETDGFLSSKTEDADKETGSADHALGFKWHACDGDRMVPSMAILVHADFDSGSAEFRGHAVRPSLRVVGEWEGPHDTSFGIMPGINFDSDENKDRYVGLILAAVAGKSWTERYRTFIEIAGHQFASDKHGGNQITGDVGMAYLVCSNFQLDTAASWGLTTEAPDFSWTAGASIRLGGKD